MKIPKQAPKPGFYYHYKHDPSGPVNDYAYEVCAVGFHTEEEQCFVNYRPLYESAFVYKASKELGIQCQDNRPLDMWMGDVTKEGRKFPRFQEITDEGVLAELRKIRDKMYPPQI